jgi:hypothetical protein
MITKFNTNNKQQDTSDFLRELKRKKGREEKKTTRA